jgi:hypothetical protein
VDETANVTTLPTTPAVRDIAALGRPKSTAARRFREQMIVGTLAIAATFSILVTTTIVIVLARETWGFFHFPDVSVGEFFGGLEWNPLLGSEKHLLEEPQASPQPEPQGLEPQASPLEPQPLPQAEAAGAASSISLATILQTLTFSVTASQVVTLRVAW